MEVQPFAKNQWRLGQTIIVDNVLWFKGKDVANSLEYARTRDALQKHVDPEDKLTSSELAKSAVDLDSTASRISNPTSYTSTSQACTLSRYVLTSQKPKPSSAGSRAKCYLPSEGTDTMAAATWQSPLAKWMAE